ncbi:MAG: RNA methyltransferase [Nonlabens sp.]
MVTKARLKLIKSLSRKKFRKEYGLFVVEGYKSISELIDSGLECEEILITEGNHHLNSYDPEVVSKKEMQSLSNVTTPPGYLAVFKTPSFSGISEGPTIALDNIKDPGNLGTIIRLADWYGIKNIVCSDQSVDCYNPKCVQASMGSIARVQIHYLELFSFLENTDLPIHVTAMEGSSIYKTNIFQDSIIVMGNESHGVRPEILERFSTISIPRAPSETDTESLNVAIATSIVVSEWMRPFIEK